MYNIKTKFLSVLAVIIIIISSATISAQELSLSTDIYNRYIWRGSELGGNTPSLQPTIEFTTGGLTAGFWGAYSLSDPTGLNEIDIYAKYSFDLAESGSISVGVIDYTNPNSGTKMGNFNDYNDPEGAGAHFIEMNIGYTGPECFPISLSLNYFLYNVANNPLYFEVGYDTSIKDVGLNLFVGGTPGETGTYYGVTDFSLINIGFKATKEIKITDSFSIPMSGSIILNPTSEDLFYVVGITL